MIIKMFLDRNKKFLIPLFILIAALAGLGFLAISKRPPLVKVEPVKEPLNIVQAPLSGIINSQAGEVVEIKKDYFSIRIFRPINIPGRDLEEVRKVNINGETKFYLVEPRFGQKTVKRPFSFEGMKLNDKVSIFSGQNIGEAKEFLAEEIEVIR